MYDTNFEKPKDKIDLRTPEEIERDNLERQEQLGGMFDADCLQSSTHGDGGARNGMDERKVFDALDDKQLAQEVGVQNARSEIAGVYDEMTRSGSPEAVAIYNQEKNAAVQAEAALGDAVDKEAVAARVGAEVLNNAADGTADDNNRAILGTEDMTKVTRATTGANLLEKVESHDEALEGFTDNTKSRLLRFVQMVRNRGGVEKTSNQDLEDAGRYIEQNPDVQAELEAHDESQQPDVEKLIVAWLQDDKLGVHRELQELDDATRQTVEAYLAAKKADSAEVDASSVRADIAEIVSQQKAA